MPGTMVTLSETFVPALIKGLTVDPQNPLHFHFIVDTARTSLQGEALRRESDRLIKYFLASLTVPEQDLWVNLSPYEQDRIIPDAFGTTEMGRDLLAQDYILKQLSASLVYPQSELGEKFWEKVHQKAYELYGQTQIPLNTFNKVWIVPDQAVVFEHENTAYVVESHLKVMLDEDYVALNANAFNAKSRTALGEGDERRGMGRDIEKVRERPLHSDITSEIIREIIIPEIEREVNEGQTFAQLRQIYHSMILATWYKRNLKESLLGQVYADKNKTRGIELEDKTVKEKIYHQYVEAFSQGVYDFIKEEYDPASGDIVPRKYFSGGIRGFHMKEGSLREVGVNDLALLSSDLTNRIAATAGSSTQHLVNVNFVETVNGDRATRAVDQAYADAAQDQAMVIQKMPEVLNGVLAEISSRKDVLEVRYDPYSGYIYIKYNEEKNFAWKQHILFGSTQRGLNEGAEILEKSIPTGLIRITPLDLFLDEVLKNKILQLYFQQGVQEVRYHPSFADVYIKTNNQWQKHMLFNITQNVLSQGNNVAEGQIPAEATIVVQPKRMKMRTFEELLAYLQAMVDPVNGPIFQVSDFNKTITVKFSNASHPMDGEGIPSISIDYFNDQVRSVAVSWFEFGRSKSQTIQYAGQNFLDVSMGRDGKVYILTGQADIEFGDHKFGDAQVVVVNLEQANQRGLIGEGTDSIFLAADAAMVANMRRTKDELISFLMNKKSGPIANINHQKVFPNGDEIIRLRLRKNEKTEVAIGWNEHRRGVTYVKIEWIAADGRQERLIMLPNAPKGLDAPPTMEVSVANDGTIYILTQWPPDIVSKDGIRSGTGSYGRSSFGGVEFVILHSTQAAERGLFGAALDSVFLTADEAMTGRVSTTTMFGGDEAPRLGQQSIITFEELSSWLMDGAVPPNIEHVRTTVKGLDVYFQGDHQTTVSIEYFGKSGPPGARSVTVIWKENGRMHKQLIDHKDGDPLNVFIDKKDGTVYVMTDDPNIAAGEKIFGDAKVRILTSELTRRRNKSEFVDYFQKRFPKLWGFIPQIRNAVLENSDDQEVGEKFIFSLPHQGRNLLDSNGKTTAKMIWSTARKGVTSIAFEWTEKERWYHWGKKRTSRIGFANPFLPRQEALSSVMEVSMGQDGTIYIISKQIPHIFHEGDAQGMDFNSIVDRYFRAVSEDDRPSATFFIYGTYHFGGARVRHLSEMEALRLGLIGTGPDSVFLAADKAMLRRDFLRWMGFTAATFTFAPVRFLVSMAQARDVAAFIRNLNLIAQDAPGEARQQIAESIARIETQLNQMQFISPDEAARQLNGLLELYSHIEDVDFRYALDVFQFALSREDEAAFAKVIKAQTINTRRMARGVKIPKQRLAKVQTPVGNIFDNPNLVEAFNWFKARQHPQTGLVRSYEEDNNPNAYIYDQALSIMMLIRAYQEAKVRKEIDKNEIKEKLDKLVNAVISLQNTNDGSWFDSYQWDMNVALDRNKRVARAAWVSMALLQYYNLTDGQATKALESAKKAISWAKQFQHMNQADGIYGAFKISNSNVRTGSEENADIVAAMGLLVEASDRFSTENNPILTKIERDDYITRIKLVADWLTSKGGTSANGMWKGHFGFPYFESGSTDLKGTPDFGSFERLDSQTWTWLALKSTEKYHGYKANDFNGIPWLVGFEAIMGEEFTERGTGDAHVLGKVTFTVQGIAAWTEGMAQVWHTAQLQGILTPTNYFNEALRFQVAAGGVKAIVGNPSTFDPKFPPDQRWKLNNPFQHIAAGHWVTLAGTGLNPFELFPEVKPPVAVEDRPRDTAPTDFELSQNYPNPVANGRTSFDYRLNKPGDVIIEVLNIKGEHVDTLVNAAQQPGSYTITWNAGNYASGEYLVRMKFAGEQMIKKVILDKAMTARPTDSDQALAIDQTTNPFGGIHLDPAMLNLQIKRDGNGIPLPVSSQPIESIQIDGIIPVIINIQPITNVPVLLGIADQLPADPNTAGKDGGVDDLAFVIEKKQPWVRFEKNQSV